MVIWKLPKPSHNHPHGLKYRLYCGSDKLIDDFMQDCARLAGWRWTDAEN
jgi:hypothetical protein